jgi:hypothetical protein
VTDKKSIDDKADESKVTALIQHEPIHYHILPPNEPHPCDNMDAQEKPNTNSATVTSVMTKQSVILKKLKRSAKKKASS